jgi:hypothetical protein
MADEKDRVTDLTRLRDFYSQFQKAEKVFQFHKAFCQELYGKDAVRLAIDTRQPIGHNDKKMKPGRREGPSADQVILQIISKIEKPVVSSKEIIQMCNESEHHYDVGTIYRTLNKLAKQEKLKKIKLSRDGKRAVDWRKINIIKPLFAVPESEEKRKEVG